MNEATTQHPWADDPYSIKRHGISITNCDSEPINTPGCIQSHGALLAVRINDLTVLQASENTGEWLGVPPDGLLGRSIETVVGPAHTQRLRETLAHEPVQQNPLHVFTLDGQVSLDVTVHTNGGVAIVEFEPDGRVAAWQEPDYYSLLKKTIANLQQASTLADFCQRVSEEIRALTGMDRVMVYRFHSDQHGEVVAESKRADLPAWLGLHYPADDIPKPARDIFEKIWIRPLPDAKALPVELLPLANPDTGQSLDMTYCALRGASVMYTEYLQNMGVAASLTMAIHWQGKLWGLVACHHYRPLALPYFLRASCEFLAQVVSLQIKPVADRENLIYQIKLENVHAGLVAASAEAGELSTLTEGRPNLLDGIDADGVAMYHRDRWWRAGRAPGDAELEALAGWLASRPELADKTRPTYVTDCLSQDYPEAKRMAGIASGLLAVSLSPNHKSLLLWFRAEFVQTIHWAGSPHDKPTTPGPHGPRLTPRKSFELYVESVRDRSKPWLDLEIEAALRLRVAILELVVGRAERLDLLNTELTRSNEELDTFAYVASHDLKEPLRGISKYAHQLLDNTPDLDPESRQRLQSLLRLTYRMDDLLDSLLHFSRVGRTALALEPVDIGEIVEEALEIVSARRAEGQTEIVIPRPLPRLVCDRVRAREIFANLIGNALKYNDKPVRRVEIGHIAPGEPAECPQTPKAAAHQHILYVRDNGIGIEPRHYPQVFKIFKRLHGREDYGGGTGAGLAIVQMLIERHHGVIWLDSQPGEGSTFFFTLGAGAS